MNDRAQPLTARFIIALHVAVCLVLPGALAEEPGQLLQEVQKASKPTSGDAPRKLSGKNADKKLGKLRNLLRHAPDLRERLTREAVKNGSAELAAITPFTKLIK